MKAIRAKTRTAGQTPRGHMNKLEARYAAHLDLQKLSGEILDWKYEAIKLRLAEGAFYTADFAVQMLGGWLELHEVKGTWQGRGQDAARLRLKVAAREYPWFLFLAVMETKGKGDGWDYEEIKP